MTPTNPWINGKKVCTRCKLPKEDFRKKHKAPGGIDAVCHDCVVAIGRKRYKLLRLIAFRILGQACLCCGESRIEFLEIDHIGGWRSHGLRFRPTIYNVLVRMYREGYPVDKYRVLCSNCNQSLGKYGYCPHDCERPTPP